jgi:predicted permease
MGNQHSLIVVSIILLNISIFIFITEICAFSVVLTTLIVLVLSSCSSIRRSYKDDI